MAQRKAAAIIPCLFDFDDDEGIDEPVPVGGVFTQPHSWGLIVLSHNLGVVPSHIILDLTILLLDTSLHRDILCGLEFLSLCHIRGNVVICVYSKNILKGVLFC